MYIAHYSCNSSSGNIIDSGHDGGDAIEHIFSLQSYNSFPYYVTGGKWTINIGKVTLSVKQGDITCESTDAIVNSSNAELQLERG